MTKKIKTNNSLLYEDKNNHDNIGWICPKCKKSISPNEKSCPYCSTKNITNEMLNDGEMIICG